MRFILPFVILFSFAGAQAEVLSLNYFAADAANSKAIQKTVEDVRNNSLTVKTRSIVLDFDEIPRVFSIDWRSTVGKVYPQGDFYYLIGNLTDNWTSSDFARFYSVAKWLAWRGFRVIINPIAFVSDVREAVQNPRTSAVIWNSHGATSGAVLDSSDVILPKDIFIKNASPRFKYLLFANCSGAASKGYYGIDRVRYPVSYGWSGDVTSDDLFNYLFGTDFDAHLSKALNVQITRKSGRDI